MIWSCRHRDHIRATTLEAQTWYAAREKAMRHFGCGPGEVDVTPWDDAEVTTSTRLRAALSKSNGKAGRR